ncbi:MAG: hypothetical protein FWD58_01535 [Firmicutes bacterium]|nr:hypothetical protein [Bacillota bacterium]
MKTRLARLAAVLAAVMLLSVAGCTAQAPQSGFAPNAKPLMQTGETLPVLRYVYEKDGEEEMSEDFEDFWENIPENQEIITVFCLDFEEIECEFRQNHSVESTLEDVDAVLAGHHANQKAYHEPRNRRFIADIGFIFESEVYEVTVDAYGPFVQVVFENVAVFVGYRESIEDVKNSELIAWIYIGAVLECEETALREPTSHFMPIYTMSSVLSDTGATSQTYTGAGINIGVIEAKGVTSKTSHTELNVSRLNIYTHPSNAPIDATVHAQRVIRTLCGTIGLARGVNHVYNCYVPSTDYDFYIKNMAGSYLNNCTRLENIEYTSYYTSSYTQLRIEVHQYTSKTGAYVDYGAVSWTCA